MWTLDPFRWWRHRRRRALAAQPFPAAWQAILDTQVAHVALLSDDDRARLRELVQIFCADLPWEGCRGFEVTDGVRVTIAALMAIPVLHLPEEAYDHVSRVLVYPAEFVAPDVLPLGGEIALHGESARLGEAHAHGEVILAWSTVEQAAREVGYGENVVFHEFAHQLDLLNGEFDGTPRLPSADLARRWADVMLREYQRLTRAADRGRETLLDPYGAESPAEFFAVATECFFDASPAMRAELPQLYALFRDYYRQDPAAWAWPRE